MADHQCEDTRYHMMQLSERGMANVALEWLFASEKGSAPLYDYAEQTSRWNGRPPVW